MNRVIGIGAIGLALAGCSAVGPDYKAPDLLVPAMFARGGTAALQAAATEEWWAGLKDARLSAYLLRGSGQNLDIQTSLARIREAQAALRRTGVNSQLSGSVVAGTRVSESGDVLPSRDELSFNGSVVLDLFGGVRRGVEQGQAQLEAAQFDAGAVRLAYLSDLISTYIQARYFQNAAALTRSTIQSRRELLGLVQRRRSAGEATELEVQQARSLLNTAQADLPSLLANFEANVFAMARLLAEPAIPLLHEMRAGAPQPLPGSSSGPGIPADLLRNRPDVRSAERNLAAATAAIGVSEAQLYPSLVLSGTIASGTADTVEFGPRLILPVLNRGVLRANRDVAQAQAEQASLTWEATVFRAIEEVQAAYSRCLFLSRQVKVQRQAVATARRVLSLSRESYAVGEVALTDVIDAEIAVASQRLALALTVRDYALAWSSLQVAAGKGWSAPVLARSE